MTKISDFALEWLFYGVMNGKVSYNSEVWIE